jgi:hypothetical protein
MSSVKWFFERYLVVDPQSWVRLFGIAFFAALVLRISLDLQLNELYLAGISLVFFAWALLPSIALLAGISTISLSIRETNISSIFRREKMVAQLRTQGFTELTAIRVVERHWIGVIPVFRRSYSRLVFFNSVTRSVAVVSPKDSFCLFRIVAEGLIATAARWQLIVYGQESLTPHRCTDIDECIAEHNRCCVMRAVDSSDTLDSTVREVTHCLNRWIHLQTVAVWRRKGALLFVLLSLIIAFSWFGIQGAFYSPFFLPVWAVGFFFIFFIRYIML